MKVTTMSVRDVMILNNARTNKGAMKADRKLSKNKTRPIFKMRRES